MVLDGFIGHCIFLFQAKLSTCGMRKLFFSGFSDASFITDIGQGNVYNPLAERRS